MIYEKITVPSRSAAAELLLPAGQAEPQDRLLELLQLTHFQREALDAAAIVAVTDRAGVITSVNTKFCQISGYEEAELVGSTHRIVRSGQHDRAFFQDLYRTISRGDVWHGVICNRAKAGHLYWVDTTIVPHNDGSGYTAIRFDVTPQKEAEQRLWRLANVDPLTGLPNRRRVIELLGEAAAGDAPFTLAILDVDHFKDVNDSAGHDVGDRLLQAVAHCLRDAIRPGDALGRLGGDEFAVILRNDGGADEARCRLDAISRAIAADPALQAFGWTVQASIGAARFRSDATDTHDLLKWADMALYAAKRGGRGCARLFAPEMSAEADRRAETRVAIQRALLADEMFVVYQPIATIGLPQPMAFEALLRWRRSDGSVHTPASFADVFEDDRTSAEIGTFVLTQVLAQIARWNAAGVPFQSIAINATLGDFRASSFVDRIVAEVDAGRLRSDQLCVEITEGMLLDRGARAVRASIDRLHARGIQIAFDDFGTGFASLTHLRQLPISRVKIDKSFIEAICADHKDRVIVKSVIDLAHQLDINVVAEGVEQPEQAELLRTLACDRIQGFLISPGIGEQEAAHLARTNTAPLAA